AGVPGREDRVGAAVGDRADGAHERGVRLRAHGFARLLGHADRLLGDDERETAGVETGRPVERYLDPFGRRRERTCDNLLGCAVPAQRVDSDAGHDGLPGEAHRLDLAALVGTARRADAVGELRRAALRAGVDPRRLEGMRGPALVATG